MALIDAIQELDEKIAERDGTPLPEKAAEPTEEAAPETEQEDTEQEQPAKQEAETPAEPAKPTDADFARMRREKAAADKRAAELAAEIERLRAPKPVEQPKAAVDAEPDKAANYEGWLEWKNRQLEAQVQNVGKTVEDVKAWKEKTEQERQMENTKVQARKELETFEQEFSKTVPDYQQKRDFVIQTIARSLQVVNPSLQGEALAHALEMQVFRLAAQAQAQGFNPIEDLYHKAEAWGYQPKQEAPAEEQPAKASIAKIAENKKKSASPMTAGGRSGAAPLSKDAVSKMKFSDVAKLSPEQFRQWETASKQFEA